MDRQWMYNADRRSKEFIDGLHYFLSVAEANKQNSFMCYPCVHCNNNKDYSSSRILHSHIFANGFMKKYVCWTKHGEQGVTMEDNGRVWYFSRTFLEKRISHAWSTKCSLFAKPFQGWVSVFTAKASQGYS